MSASNVGITNSDLMILRVRLTACNHGHLQVAFCERNFSDRIQGYTQVAYGQEHEEMQCSPVSTKPPLPQNCRPPLARTSLSGSDCCRDSRSSEIGRRFPLRRARRVLVGMEHPCHSFGDLLPDLRRLTWNWPSTAPPCVLFSRDSQGAQQSATGKDGTCIGVKLAALEINNADSRNCR